jgi:hypothetical protein
MANSDYFPIELVKKTHIFACIINKTIILLEIIIEAKNDPENAFPN